MASTHDCWYWRAGEVERGLVGTRESFYDLATSTVLQDLLDINEVSSVLVPRFGDDSLLDKCKDSPTCSTKSPGLFPEIPVIACSTNISIEHYVLPE